jgi:DNA-binding Xre family transcriptional regulator
MSNATQNKTVLHSNLDDILADRNISMREFARRIDYRFDSVRKLCYGELARIPVDLIERTLEELKIDISELFTTEKGEE